MMKINTILKNLNIALVANNYLVKALKLDSRQLQEGDCWLAVQGIHYHALDFYSSQQKCAGILYEPPYNCPPKDAVAVANLSQKVSAIADLFYDRPTHKLNMIGVTGTDGKSSLVHFIAQALNCAMIGTIGIGKLDSLSLTSHTTPDALTVQKICADLMAQNVHSIAMEVSSHALDQYRVAAVDFDIAVFSNLSRDHLDYHGDIDAYFAAKAKLFSMPIKHAIINIDDHYGRKLIETNKIHRGAQLWLISANNRDYLCAGAKFIRAQSFELSSSGISLTVAIDDQQITIHTRLIARFNVDNILNVIACLLAMGYSIDEVKGKIAALKGVPGRVEVIEQSGKKAIVDYAHTVGAFESVLTGIRPHVKGQIWVIFGCGGDRDKGKRSLMASIAEQYADHLIITDDNPRFEDPNAIIANILEGISDRDRVTVIQPRDKAIADGLSQMQTDDVLLILGKGHENYQIFGDVKQPFSDKEVVLQCLNHI